MACVFPILNTLGVRVSQAQANEKPSREFHEQGNHHRRRPRHRGHHRARVHVPVRHHTNVLDISQTIIDGFFNMMMIVDYADADVSFETIVNDLEELGEEIGVRIRCQREEIFTKMHRV